MIRMNSLIGALFAATALVAPANAQTASAVDLRVGKLEKEMKAVQRVVFPGGTPLQPELGTPAAPGTAPGSPASTPVADLTARVDALEKGLATLTGQVEQGGYRQRLSDEAFKRLEARVATLEGTTSATPAAAAVPSAVPTATPPKPAMAAIAKSAVVRPSAPVPTPPPAVKIDPRRKAAVAAVEMPATGDAAEDDYTYGFRLYTAKFYPEAVTKLKEFIDKYPAHKRASYARNLLGRAYYDDGKPALASVAFYDNYQKLPKGDRASESLYWLGQALTRLKKLPDACKVYDELQDAYGTKLSADLKARAAKGRADAKCPA